MKSSNWPKKEDNLSKPSDNSKQNEWSDSTHENDNEN